MIANGVIVDAQQSIDIYFTVFYVDFIPLLLAEYTYFEHTVVIVSDSEQIACRVLWNFFAENEVSFNASDHFAESLFVTL